METARRTPQQARGEARVASFLEAAASVIAEHGYDAATMTAIAERAGASIGAVYQYFPNKAAIGHALRVQYSKEMAQQWSELADSAARMDLASLAGRIVELMVALMETRPAYMALLTAALSAQRDQDERRRLRERFAALFRAHAPWLDAGEALRVANVTLQIVKSMNPLYAQADAEERRELVAEYRTATTAYLQARLRR